MTFEISNGILGKRFTLTGPWTEDLINFYSNAGCVELELNSGKGWRDESLEFVLHIPKLHGLIVLSPYLKSCNEVSKLTDLEILELDSNCKGSIDFRRFHRIIDCGFDWRAGASTIFFASTLQKLYINKYPGKNVTQFHTLTDLRELILLGSKLENLQGICALGNLKYLRIGLATHLTDIKDIELLWNLQYLEFSACRLIKNFSSIASLTKLRRLEIIDCGQLDNIDWISSLSLLEELFFYGDTNVISGDISPLKSLPRLRKVGFARRRHYSHIPEDFL